jgi:hypothetical protein
LQKPVPGESKSPHSCLNPWGKGNEANGESLSF